MEALSTFNANASRMAISTITLAELIHGAEKSQYVSQNLATIEDFCSRIEVLPCGMKAAQHYGVIRALKAHRISHGMASCVVVIAEKLFPTIIPTKPANTPHRKAVLSGIL
ncbi:MAG: hypothetical protein LRY56_00680 [Burkholderiaceae bacterium]|nr:hypothetical protein [Burkholderiaceae bacterium]MCD8536096.1 hypothetical protein [Burkholderiaceae bacterium]